MLRYIDKFRKGAMTPVFLRRNPKNHPVIAEIVQSFQGIPVIKRINCRIKGNPVAFLPFADFFPRIFNYPCSFMSHDNRRDPAAGASVHTMNIASAYPHSLYPYQYFIVSNDRIGPVTVNKPVIFLKDKCFHPLI